MAQNSGSTYADLRDPLIADALVFCPMAVCDECSGSGCGYYARSEDFGVVERAYALLDHCGGISAHVCAPELGRYLLCSYYG